MGITLLGGLPSLNIILHTLLGQMADGRCSVLSVTRHGSMAMRSALLIGAAWQAHASGIPCLLRLRLGTIRSGPRIILPLSMPALETIVINVMTFG